MKIRLMLGILAALLLTVSVASAAVESAAEFLTIVDQRVERGELSADEALLLKFQYCFEREKLPSDLQPTWKAPMKSATGLVIQYMNAKDRLPSAITADIERYLAPPSEGTRLEHFSDSGKFRINYYTTGEHSVPLADSDSNGIPDRVELVADFMDYSYDVECEQAGFQSPPFEAAGGHMSVYMANLDGVYGFCTPLSTPSGWTRISVDNDFIGYPPNDDPDGNSLGAAKVTCAHEFKHSTQYAGSFWSEDGWVEVDAVWTEEFVFPATNDYLNYLPYNSPISHPHMALDSGSTNSGTYEDAVWQIYMSDRFASPQIIVDFWDYRKTNRFEPVMDSYEAILGQYGLTLTEAWNEFTMWNFASGLRRVDSELGYHDAEHYPTGSPQHTVMSYPTTDTGYVTHLAANFQRLLNVNVPGYRVRVTFNGNDAGIMTLGAVVNVSYTTHEGALYPIPLDENNDATFDVPYDLDGVYSVGMVIGNAEKVGGNRNYTITVDLVEADITDAGDTAPAFAMAGNYPNPFNPSTTFKFSLGGTGQTTLDLFDVTGRKVRTLVNAVLDAGEHTIMWNGRDDSGQALASGTYLAKLRSGDQITTHKLVLAK